MGANRIMYWKIMDVKIWFECTLYASWLCEEKEKLKKWLCEIEMRMKILQRGQKWKEKKIKKWNDPREGKLRREWDPYGEIPKSLPREDSKWGVHLGTNAYPSMKAWEWQCIVWLHVSICIMVAFGRMICIIYQVYVWIYYSRLKWLIYFVNLKLLIC